MWNYIKRYLFFAVLAGLFMVGEVLADLVQPGIMSRIVDDGVLGAGSGGTPDIQLIWMLGLRMIGIVLLGGLCGFFNNVFVHISSQNIGNEIRKDCFRRIMDFSFSQLDRFGTGSLVTRVTNDITQVQTFVSLFVRGMIRTLLLTFGSMYFMFRLNRDFGLIVLCAFPFLSGVIVCCLWKANDELTKTQLKTLVIFAFMNPLTNALMYVAVAVILLTGAYEAGSGRTTPGNIMAALTYTTQLLNGILMLVMLFQNISRGITSWKRVKELLSSRPELADGSFEGESRIQGEIEFRDVSFSYPGSCQSVLSHINYAVVLLSVGSAQSYGCAFDLSCNKNPVGKSAQVFTPAPDAAWAVKWNRRRNDFRVPHGCCI